MKTILTALIALPLTLAAVGCEQDVIDLDTLDAAAEQQLIEAYDAEMDEEDEDDNDSDLDITDSDDPTHSPDNDVDDFARDLGPGDPLPGGGFTVEDQSGDDEGPNQGFVVPPASDGDDDLGLGTEDPDCGLPTPEDNDEI